MTDSRARLIYGLHAVKTVLERRPESIVAAWLHERATGKRLAGIEAVLEALGIKVNRAARSALDRQSGGGAHQGVVIEVRAGEEFTVRELEAMVVERGRSLRLLVLDRVEDPRNLGACLRTADACGIDAVIVPQSRAARVTPAARKAATGAAETVPVHRAANLARTLAWLKAAGVWIVGADGTADRSLYESELRTPLAVVVGGEGRGLRRLTRKSCDELVAIPMHGMVASLNVSVACGVVLYELLRRCPVDGRPGTEPPASGSPRGA
ncbi:23S rRNA (guanosine(2251)-2'-O)-methyltransferase RlmB [Candidatus Rariloculus sp.]|uniref:23S rRNA (guanosine(2251)-2'-O)-methyltransferase RlmB n=1 Tax=Candidatus Rariloculus sp. TaxID=3101265 RepID=UPI003D0A130E